MSPRIADIGSNRIGPYRTPAEREKEEMQMDSNTKEVHMFKYAMIAGIVVLFACLGACTFTQHDANMATIHIAEIGAAHAKADADKAMFDSMGREKK